MLPSLLYGSKPTDRKISLSVFKDLQLLNFIPDCSARCVLKTCSSDDRKSRGQIFSHLINNSESLKLFEKLSDAAKEVRRADSVFSSSRTETEKYILFVNLAEKYRLFAKTAVRICFGDPLTETFAQAFERILSSSKFTALSQNLDDAVNARTAITSFSLKISEEKTYSSNSDEPSFFEIIEKSSRVLGIDIEDTTLTDCDRLSPDIIEYISSRESAKICVLKSFYNNFKGVYDESVKYYYDECVFYLSFASLIMRAKEIGVPFTFAVESYKRQIKAENVYDISLIAKDEKAIVPNDVLFCNSEPFFYLTGANDGGKTTYLRAVGIITVMYLLGCPVPATCAEIGGIDCVYTHFPRDERFDGSGRFVEENKRVAKILENCDDHSLVLLNETYSATNEENAVRYTSELAGILYEKGIFGLYITHQHGLSSEEKIPFLRVVVDENDSNRRTFKIEKCRNTGGSFANDILRRYGLTPEALNERFMPLIDRFGMNGKS